MEHKRFKVPLKCSTSGATYNDDRWLFVGLGVRWEGFVIFTLPPCQEADQVFPPRALHSFSFSYANCDCAELLRHSKLMKCQPAVRHQHARPLFCLCFSQLNQLNEVLRGKCLVLQAELSGTFCSKNFRSYKVSSAWVSGYCCVGEKFWLVLSECNKTNVGSE